ncbi:MAG: class I SAM-dependent methyltransferase [Rhodospirillaceae bacterium]|nr:class I SAM-dependent methyltransferase [Rhodospirillaceae bacterium]
MDTEKLGQSRFLNIFFRPAGVSMESQLRRWLMPPRKTLQGADVKPGQTVLEVGCGTGFFTLPAAEMIGESGRLIAMDPLSDFVDRVKKKVRDAGLKNVEVVRRDALNTGLETASIDMVLLFGVLPYPTLPLDRLLPEVHRILKEKGTLAVWLFPISFGVPNAILRSGLFSDLGKKNGVYKYGRSESSI